MVAPPDFDQIAREFSERAFPSAVITSPKPEWETRKEMIAAFAEQLRQVWNARGAADLATVNGSLLTGDMPKVVDERSPDECTSATE